MDKIAKALKKLSEKEKYIFKSLLLQIKSQQFDNLDIKKLKGRDDIYRVRKDKMRIIFIVNQGRIKILTL